MSDPVEAQRWRRIASLALDLADRVRSGVDGPVEALTPAVWSGPAAERTAAAAQDQRIAVWAAAATLEHHAEIALHRAAQAEGS